MEASHQCTWACCEHAIFQSGGHIMLYLAGLCLCFWVQRPLLILLPSPKRHPAVHQQRVILRAHIAIYMHAWNELCLSEATH